jgi:hypothetical protein
LIYFARKYQLEAKLHITVLSSDRNLEATVRSTASFCLDGDSALLSSMEFLSWNGKGRISEPLQRRRGGTAASSFDYIEYNGGLSLDPNSLSHLRDLKSVTRSSLLS